jgi:hypothetical protein
VVVVFDSVPPPLTLHVTPLEFLSFVTVAVSVTVFVASTVVAVAVTATLADGEPPQPDKHNATNIEKPTRTKPFRDIGPPN